MKPTEEQVRQRVARAGRSSLDGRDTGAADLSDAAIAERRRAAAAGAPDGGWTGHQLIDLAARNLQEANRLAKVAVNRPAGSRRRRKASDRADEALRSAALQIRVAQAIPLDRGYLHHLTMDKIQTAQAEVGRAFLEDAAALAVDTHRRIQDQRHRRRAEGA